jgi:hypothetical protein
MSPVKLAQESVSLDEHAALEAMAAAKKARKLKAEMKKLSGGRA